MQPVREAEGPAQIGDYPVLGTLGHGAMGTVYLGRSPGGRLVAVKVVRPELAADPRFRERFRHEVSVMRAVGGFWTVAVVDADPDAPNPWLATEYVPGPNLHDMVSGHGPLPEPALRRLVAGLAEALAAIHRAGLVHRDLKPGNVLLAADGPRVIDFGIAKTLQDTGLTGTGLLVGTPGFLSPEQIEGREVSPASDVLIAKAASLAGNRGAAFLFFLAFVVLGVSAVRLLWQLTRPRHWIEVSGAGLVVGKGTTAHTLPWSHLARVRVVEDARRPWLVVWPRDQATVHTEFAADHGGFRVFPVGHERRSRARGQEIRELRAALAWYGRTRYDPNP